MRTSEVLATVVVWAIGTGVRPAGAVEVRPIALTGQPAPGGSPGEVFVGFDFPWGMNDLGQVVFMGRTAIPGGAGPSVTGIYSEGSGTLDSVATVGAAAPSDLPGTVFSSFPPFFRSIDNHGRVAFAGRARNASANFPGVWLGDAEGLTLAQRGGGSAIGFPPGYQFTSTDIQRMSQSRGGDLIFRANASESPTSSGAEGMWIHRGGKTELVLRYGQPAPGVPRGVFDLSGSTPQINSTGQIAFGNYYYQFAGAERTGHAGIWSDRSGALSLVAALGSKAPEPGPNATFVNISAFGVGFNDAGQIAFSGTARGSGTNPDTVKGLWIDDQGMRRLAIRTEWQAPGLADGIALASIDNSVLNHSGIVAIQGRLSGDGVDASNDQGIWASSIDSTMLLAREGDTFAGTDWTWTNLGAPSMNRDGWVAFTATQSSRTQPGQTRSCAFAGKLDHSIIPVLCAGDMVALSEDDWRELASVSALTQSGGEDGNARWLNDANQMALRASFADGTFGIIVATIPEPATLGLLAVLVTQLNTLKPNPRRRIAQ